MGNNATAANSWGGSVNNAATTQAEAETKGNFFTFSIAANAGYSLSLAGITPLWMRRSTAGPPNIVLQYRIGAGSFQDINNSLNLSTTSNTNFGAIDLSGIGNLQNVSPATVVTFRLVGFGGTTGALYVSNGVLGDDLAVTGTVTLLPPTAPSNIAIGGGSTPNSIILNWTDNSTTEASFTIERATTAGGPWTELSNTIPANTTTYTDNTPAGVAYFYRVKAVNTAGSSAYASTSGALPVTYLNFAARATEIGQVRVSWATTNEQNNAYFAVERSSDLVNYTELGRVQGKGITQVRQEYTFIDEAPAPGYNYYRLKQVDTDGTFSYSRAVAVLNEASLDAALVVYPNPATSAVGLRLKNAVQSASLISTQGVRRVVPVQSNSVDVSGLPTGVYLLEVQTTAGQVLRQRLVKE
jgi:hypothetical protein